MRCITIVVLTLIAAGVAAVPDAPSADVTHVFVDVTVISMLDPEPLPQRTVLVANDRCE